MTHSYDCCIINNNFTGAVIDNDRFPIWFCIIDFGGQTTNYINKK